MTENETDFVNATITGDKSWCFTCDPLTKQQSASWVDLKLRVKKLRFQKLKIKIIFILFFDSRGVVYKGFVPEGQTVTKEFYLEVLAHLLKWIARVKPEVWKNHSFNLLHDNALAHTTIVQEFLTKKKGFQWLANLCTLPIWVLWTTLHSPNWKWNWKATSTKIF